MFIQAVPKSVLAFINNLVKMYFNITKQFCKSIVPLKTKLFWKRLNFLLILWCSKLCSNLNFTNANECFSNDINKWHCYPKTPIVNNWNEYKLNNLFRSGSKNVCLLLRKKGYWYWKALLIIITILLFTCIVLTYL